MLTLAARKDWSGWEKRIIMELSLAHHSFSKIPVEYRCGGKVRVKSDVDFVTSIEGKPVWFDAKQTKDKLWNLKEFVLSASKAHQYAKLKQVHMNGDEAGYLLLMSFHKMIVWVPIVAVDFALKNGHASIHPNSEYARAQKEDTNIQFKALVFGDDRDKKAPSTNPP